MASHTWPGLYHFRLGAHLHPQRTEFRVFAPGAQQVDLLLWQPGEESQAQRLAMQPMDAANIPEQQGCWELSVAGEREGWHYLFEVDERRSIDPYGRASTANAAVSVVAREAPLQRMAPFEGNPVIYEAHVRDMTIHPDAGVEHPGTFLGLAQRGTTTPSGHPTGLDYIASLGVTHVQLLPIFDFATVDELGDRSFNAQYNWGYDPVQYNVPEGSYSSNPEDPMARIEQCKAMIQAMHDAGLRVVMDVVYNHVYEVANSSLHHTAPGYYFRYRKGELLNGTGVGNETASEQPMMRKLIVDSVMYWAEEFGIDGFRFDLMGIHDVHTMNAVREALDTIDPSILLLGEGWSMGHHPKGVDGANQRNEALMPRIYHFNDAYRDAIKGPALAAHSTGVISGARSEALMRQLFQEMAGQGLQQSVVYNEAHDNATMFDKLNATLAGYGEPWCDREQDLVRRCMLATQLQFFSRGWVFIHAGQEMMRTKGGDENSYRSSDSTNAFDYARAERFSEQVERFRRMCALRQQWVPQCIEGVEITADHMVFRVDGRTMLFDALGVRLVDLEHPERDVLL